MSDVFFTNDLETWDINDACNYSLQVDAWIQQCFPNFTTENVNIFLNWLIGIYDLEGYNKVIKPNYSTWCECNEINLKSQWDEFQDYIHENPLTAHTKWMALVTRNPTYMFLQTVVRVYPRLKTQLRGWNERFNFPIPPQEYYGRIEGYNDVMKDDSIQGEYYEPEKPEDLEDDTSLQEIDRSEVEEKKDIIQVGSAEGTIDIENNNKSLRLKDTKDRAINLFPIAFILVIILLLKKAS